MCAFLSADDSDAAARILQHLDRRVIEFGERFGIQYLAGLARRNSAVSDIHDSVEDR